MQFLLILAIVGVLSLSQTRRVEPPVSDFACALGMLVGIASISFLAWGISWSITRKLRANPLQTTSILQVYRRMQRWHFVVWFVVSMAVQYGLAWGQWVRCCAATQSVFLVDDLLILAPLILPLVLSWAAFYNVHHAVRQSAGVAVGQNGAPATRRQFVGLHIRHYLGIILLPVLFLLAIEDMVGLLIPEAFAATCRLGAMLAGLFSFLLFSPHLLSHLWQCEPLPAGTLRDRLDEVARRSGIRVKDILVWRTGRMMANAAVAGLVGRVRYVFLTDALLREMSEDEIEAVFAHELGHAHHHHLPLRLLAMAVPLILAFFVQHGLAESITTAAANLAVISPNLAAEMGFVAFAGLGIYTLLIFGRLSRLWEHQADLFAYHLIARDGKNSPTETLAMSLEKLARCNGIRRKHGSWQHASIARRIDFLEKVSRGPKHELWFQWRVALVAYIVVCLAVGPIVIHVLVG